MKFLNILIIFIFSCVFTSCLPHPNKRNKFEDHDIVAMLYLSQAISEYKKATNEHKKAIALFEDKHGDFSQLYYEIRVFMASMESVIEAFEASDALQKGELITEELQKQITSLDELISSGEVSEELKQKLQGIQESIESALGIFKAGKLESENKTETQITSPATETAPETKKPDVATETAPETKKPDVATETAPETKKPDVATETAPDREREIAVIEETDG